MNLTEIFLIVSLFLFGVNSESCTLSNSCKFNPDVDLDTVQIARRHGYPAETHQVLTEDGYLLSVHRIPGTKSGERGGQPVFLQHGLLSSSTDWVDEGNNSFAFILADMGYDVWMGNARGNTYSKAHAWLPTKSAQFWNFSWHEMGIYDLPAVLTYVGNITNKEGEIIYIGHSMGGTMFFVFASLLPEAAKNVKFMAGLAPACYMKHVSSPIRYLTPFISDFNFVRNYLGFNEFLPRSKLMRFLAHDCEIMKIDQYICEQLLFIVAGFNKEEMNPAILPVIIGHDPAGSSVKTVLHYAQEIRNNGEFQQYDYGAKGNKVKYGQITPPAYNLSNVQVPNVVMYGMGDILASYIDVKRLASELPNNLGAYKVPMESFNHVDFLFGKDAPRLVYKPLIKIMQNYTVNN